MTGIIDKLKANGVSNGVLTRMEVVYDVYANRSDAHRVVRELLPENAKWIGFAGTGDESQYSFWLPMGTRRVKDLAAVSNGRLKKTDENKAEKTTTQIAGVTATSENNATI